MALEADILRLLGERPRRAAELASALRVGRSQINALLYGDFRSRVEQDRSSYRWRLKGGGATTATPAARNGWAGLFAYYLDCLSADAGVSVSVFATGRFEVDYVQLDSWPVDAPADADWRDAEGVHKLAGRQRRQPKQKALWIGWPSYVRRARGRNNWEGAFVEPLVLWPVDADGGGLAVSPEPLLNAAALERLLGNDAAAEAVELAAELGLDEAEDLDAADLGERLRHLRPEWPWLDPPDPAALAARRLERDDVEAGLHNAAVLVLADRTSFTAGLEAELKQLESVADSDLTRSALGYLLRPGDTTSAWADGPILEVTPLNAEQREAVAMALAQPVTVVTGPPGTGKSQVVTAILANAAYRGERVLFASKNNKAVDVVEERTNALTARPLLLRLGARAAQGVLADRLMRLLSTRTDETARERGARAAAEVARLSAALATLDRQAEDLRRLANDITARDARLSELRRSLGPDRWSALAAFDASSAAAIAATLRSADLRAQRDRQAFPVRLLWPLLRGARERALTEARRAAEPLASALAVSPDGPPDHLTATIDEAGQARALWADRERLGALGSVATIAAERARVQAALRRESLAAFDGWLAGLAARLTGKQREALGDYVALLRQVSAANETNTPVSSWLELRQGEPLRARRQPRRGRVRGAVARSSPLSSRDRRLLQRALLRGHAAGRDGFRPLKAPKRPGGALGRRPWPSDAAVGRRRDERSRGGGDGRRAVAACARRELSGVGRCSDAVPRTGTSHPRAGESEAGARAGARCA